MFYDKKDWEEIAKVLNVDKEEFKKFAKNRLGIIPFGEEATNVKGRVWTPSDDKLIIEGRENGDTWASIAKRLNTSPNIALERGRRLGLSAKKIKAVIQEVKEDKSGPKEILKAGSKETWDLIMPGYRYPTE